MECPVCAGHLSDECRVRGLTVCDPCACEVANRWWKWHSGQFLTWENPPSPTPRKKTITQALRRQVFERDAYRCVHCGSHVDLAADHILAESKGGETTLLNLQTLCRSCNSRKGTR